MCYAKPGPRCSGHMSEKLNEARANHATNPIDATTKALADAQLAYDKTPEGIRAIRQQASDALGENDVDEGVRLTRLADKYTDEREIRLATHDLLKSEFGVREFVYEAQNRARASAGANSDPIGNALYDGAYVDGYDLDLSHETDSGRDEIRVAAVWSVHNPRAMYYQQRDKLSFDPDHRPTYDEAEEMVSDFNEQLEDIPTDLDEVNEYEDPIRYAVAEQVSDEEDLIRDRVAAQISGAFNYNFAGGNDLRDSAIARLRESIVFDHSTSTAVTEEAVMDLLETWDSLYRSDDEDAD